jgi:hypothetical protein
METKEMKPREEINTKVLETQEEINTEVLETQEAETIINNVNKMPDKELFLNSLNEKELKAYAIANSFLKDTFDINKSNGFIEWKSLQSFSSIINDK